MTTEQEYMGELPTLKTPPHSADAEQAVLGGLLMHGKRFDDIAGIVSEDDFFSPVNREIWRGIVKASQAGDGIDIITVAESIPDVESVGGIAYLMGLADSTPSAANLAGYAKLIKTRAVERQIIATAQEIADSGFDPDVSLEEKLANAQAAVLKIGQSDYESALINSNEALLKYVEALDKKFRGEGGAGLMTGFADIDKRTNGLQKTDLIIVAARPAMGKTTFALNIAEHVAIRERKTALVFSMEMGAMQLWDKVAASVTNINLERLRRGELQAEDWSKLTAGVNRAKDSNLFIDDRAALHINQIKATARRLHSRHPLDVVIIDYLQLARANAESREREIAEISGGLKALAKELDIPVVALSQLNRSVESRQNKRPMNSDLRESGAIEQDADIIMFLYRDEVYDEDTEQKGIAEVIFSKYRNGSIGTDFLTNRLEVSRFENAPRGYKPPPPRQKSKKGGFSYGD